MKKMHFTYRGVPVAYAREGGGDMPLLFIHGAGGESDLFQAQLSELGPRFGALAIDLPGHGESGLPAGCGFDDYHAAAGALLDHLGIRSCVAAGHSMGGGVVFGLCGARPEAVAGAIFMAAGATMPVNPAILDLIRNDYFAFCGSAPPMCFSEGDISPMSVVFRESLARCGADTAWNDFSYCAAFDYDTQARAMKIPALVISTGKDRMVSMKRIASLAEAIPGAKLVQIPGQGHMPFCDYPDAVNRAIAEFMTIVSDAPR